ncbi:MAG: formylglycine-generating enzyme family protein [Planctomycetes bacterium]|nr:formylglycine-generating enzyme family protein [Planctomycetota bacterium]
MPKIQIGKSAVCILFLGIIFAVFIGCGSKKTANGKIETPPTSPAITIAKTIDDKGMTYIGKNAQGYDEYRHEQTGMVFVQIPAGTFKMGSNDGKDDEKPVHEVILDSFLISKYEVTQEVWQKTMRSDSGVSSQAGGNNPSYFKGNQNPVECVSWNDCQGFCEKTGLRLSTEAEWEYACRAGTTTKYYWGNNEDGAYMWYGSNSGNTTHLVGQKKPNGYGLYDMSGNVWEWCEDWYGVDYYTKSPKSNPKGHDSGEYRVLRGGSWDDVVSNCRSAGRLRTDPTIWVSIVGFRVVVSSK